MEASTFIELVLTCGSRQEAQKIADALLEKHLIACAEFIEIKSKYWWEQKLRESKEVKLVMQSRAENFAKVEAEVKELHSYGVPALRAIPLTQITDDAAKWLQEMTNND